MKQPVLVLTLVLTVLVALPLTPIIAVQAGSLPDPTAWRPYGPHIGKVLLHVYADETSEFSGFTTGGVDGIDIVDWVVASADVGPFGADPDFVITAPIDEFGIFQLDFNHHNKLLGISQQQASSVSGSESTKEPTAAGIEVRRAISHLLDKPNFVTLNAALQGLGKYVDIQAPPAQNLFVNGSSAPSQFVGSPAAQAEIDKDKAAHPWFSGNLVSAYNLASDNIIDPITPAASVGFSGAADLRAACDHLVAAGIPIKQAGASCADVAAGTAQLDGAGRSFQFFIRTHIPRRNFGTIIADALDMMFDPDVTIRTVTGITQVAPIVFKTAPEVDDWGTYTGGWFLGSTPDHLYALYHSTFASNVCGGKRSTFAQNYHFYCSPKFDTRAKAGQFSATLTTAYTNFAGAAVEAHRAVMTVPVYSGAGQRFVALNGWDGLVNVAGHGFQSKYYNLLNARQAAGYTPIQAKYTPGGGDASLLRYGMREGTQHLSIFHAQTLWEFDALAGIYDSMLAANPRNPAQPYDYMSVRHSVTIDANGNTVLDFTLRGDLVWHDGQPVTANDVVFSAIKYRDIPSANLQPVVKDMISAVALDSRNVRAVYTGVSVFHELNFGGLPIIPQHIWGPLGDATMGDDTFDPMAAGIMVGSGPLVCKLPGVSGFRCAQNADGSLAGQAVALGGRFLLSANTDYMRGPSSAVGSRLYKFGYSDEDNDAYVNIVDIAKAASKFGGPDLYWDNANIGVINGQVDIVEIATVAAYFDVSLIRPQTTASMTNIDADIDPFF